MPMLHTVWIGVRLSIWYSKRWVMNRWRLPAAISTPDRTTAAAYICLEGDYFCYSTKDMSSKKANLQETLGLFDF